MVSASKPPTGYVAAFSKAAVWVSSRLSAAAALGLALIPLLQWIPPLLAPRSAAAPVEIVRTVPVPYLDPALPEEPATAPHPSAKETAAKIVQIAARRTRARREAESGALGKAGTESGETQASADPKTAAPADPNAASPDRKSAGTSPVPHEPDRWSDTEVIAALRDCLRRLAPLGAVIEVAQPVKQERCGTPAPVVLRRLGSMGSKVELQPPPTLNCAMVASLHTWVEKTLQPAAQELLGSPIARIRNISGYVCRNRLGTQYHADQLSEHALANAIDIAGFVTADGRTVDVLSQWGPTARDLREQQEKTWQAAQEAKAAAKQAEGEAAHAARAAAKAARGAKRDQATAEAARKKEEAARKREQAQQKEAEWRKSLARTAEMQKLGRGADAKTGGPQPPRPQRGDKKANAGAKGLTPIPTGEDDRKAEEAAFLRRLHRGACGTFGTVLGPDANEAHRNHFHFDLAARKRNAFCE
jgi:hypothetical protein